MLESCLAGRGAPRAARPEDIELPAGYSIEPVVVNLNYPTSVAWEADGSMLIAESAVPFGDVAGTEIRIARRRSDGSLETVAGGFPHLINDIAIYEGRIYVSHLGRISVIEDGQVRDLVTDLPSRGLHQNNAIAFGPDRRLYFGQGTVSNSGVVDSYALDHLRRAPYTTTTSQGPTSCWWAGTMRSRTWLPLVRRGRLEPSPPGVRLSGLGSASPGPRQGRPRAARS